jgi:hypothetical protein
MACARRTPTWSIRTCSPSSRAEVCQHAGARALAAEVLALPLPPLEYKGRSSGPGGWWAAEEVWDFISDRYGQQEREESVYYYWRRRRIFTLAEARGLP